MTLKTLSPTGGLAGASSGGAGRLIVLCLFAVATGMGAAAGAWACREQSKFVVNLFFRGSVSWKFVPLAEHHLGLLAFLVPVLGALLFGLILRESSGQGESFLFFGAAS